MSKEENKATTRLSKFQEIITKMINTYESKNKDYGDSFGDLCDEFGVITAIVRLQDKINRLKTIYKNKNIEVKNESVLDTLQDLANYAVMTIIWLQRYKENNPSEEIDFDKME